LKKRNEFLPHARKFDRRPVAKRDETSMACLVFGIKEWNYNLRPFISVTQEENIEENFEVSKEDQSLQTF